MAVSRQVSGVAHSRACCWQYRKTPTFLLVCRPRSFHFPLCLLFLLIRSTEYSNGPRWTWAFVAVVRKSERLTGNRGCTMPVPGTIGGVTFVLTRVKTFATRIWLAGLALIAFTTCWPVLVSAPVASVASATSTWLPVRVTVSGAFGTPGLRNSALMPLPPSWPHAREVRTTAPACRAVVGVLPGSVVAAIVAWARR